MNIACRVDGGKGIGMGHIMRTIALANDLKKDDSVRNIIYITKNDQVAIKKLKENSFKVSVIDKNLSYDEEIKKVKEIIINKRVSKLITDSYRIDQNYLNKMRKVVDKLITIHDFAPFAFPSHVVINGNIYAQDLSYESYYGDTKFLLGTDYLLLREEFKNLPEIEVRKRIKNILVTVGGSDNLNLTPKIVKALNKLKLDTINNKFIDKENLHIDVVIGPSFNNIGKITKEVEKSNLSISINYNVKKMSELMIKSDIAISSGGTTLYELAVTRTPSIALLQAENQIKTAEKLDGKTIINLGFGSKTDVEKIYNNILFLINNFDLRKKLTELNMYNASSVKELIISIIGE